MTPSSHIKRKKRGFTPEATEHIRRRYEESDEMVASIAADFKVVTKTITSLAHREGWSMRNDRGPRGLPEAIRLDQAAIQALGACEAGVVPAETDVLPETDEVTSIDPLEISSSIAVRLELAVEKELRRVEGLRNEFGPVAGRSIEAERTARTLATLTETLFKVRRLREPGQTGAIADDDMPADIDGFRHALAQRMDKFVNARADAAIPADAEPAHAAPSAS